jgi:hypothetical protein
MHDPVAVGVADRLGEPPEQRQPVGDRDTADLVGKPQVQALEAVIGRVDRTHPGLFEGTRTEGIGDVAISWVGRRGVAAGTSASVPRLLVRHPLSKVVPE